jgi:uncharacterized protein
VELTGPITVKLWISSDCPDTDFTAKLVDVYPPNEDYPDGFAMNLCHGILRCRYRDSWEAPSLMTPGEVYELTIEMFPTSNLFAAGHRIRRGHCQQQLSAFRREPQHRRTRSARHGTMRVATNRVYLDQDRPSHVILPVIPDAAG